MFCASACWNAFRRAARTSTLQNAISPRPAPNVARPTTAPNAVPMRCCARGGEGAGPLDSQGFIYFDVDLIPDGGRVKDIRVLVN